MTTDELLREVRRLIESGGAGLPLPAGGATAARHHRLAEFGRDDLSVGRIIEAHTDAVAILASAGREPIPGALYGVWAAEHPDQRLSLLPAGDGWVITGEKSFCSGVGLCDAALVTAFARGAAEPLLVELDLSSTEAAEGTRTRIDEWSSPAFEATRTGTIVIDELALGSDAVLGGPGWYLDRPGFWHGAIGPAAVWAGGAIGLVDAAEHHARSSPHGRAALGALRAIAWAMEAELEVAGAQIDAEPDDVDGARRRALTVRHLIERQAMAVIDQFGLACGPTPMAFDSGVVRRLQELQLYVRQFHGGADLEQLGSP